MNFKKLALTTSVAAAMGAAALPASAMVYGIAGEALLLPVMMNDPDNDGTGEMNTYVQIRVPLTLGSDFVLNNYTAPNVTSAGTPVTQDGDFRIYWSAYDPYSEKLRSDWCFVSAGDSVLWTTDEDLLELQRRSAVTDDDDGGFPGGQDGLGPTAVCGAEGLGPIGYVVFENFAAADGEAAEFAIEGSAWITDNRIRDDDVVSLLSVPMIPMADGEDPVPADENTSPRLGLNEVITDVNNASEIGNGVAESPVVVSPLGTGIRMNNGNPGLSVTVDFAGGLQGPYEGNLQNGGPADDNPAGYSMHILWFDQNNEDRSSAGEILVWDEHESVCDAEAPIDRELNVLVYNMSVSFDSPSFGENPWDFVDDGTPRTETLTDIVGLIEAVQGQDPFVNGEYCDPLNWNHTIIGYVQYLLEEEGTELGGAGGTDGVNAAAIAMDAQESLFLDDAWAQHLMTVRGFQ